MQPLGSPVVPDVYCTLTSVSESMPAAGGVPFRVGLDERGEIDGIAVRVAVDAKNLERRPGRGSDIEKERNDCTRRNHRTDPRVFEHEARIGRPVARVDRHHDRAEPREPEPCERPFHPVRQHDSHAVAGSDSGSGECRGEPVHARGELGERKDFGRLVEYERGAVRPARGSTPQRGHQIQDCVRPDVVCRFRACHRRVNTASVTSRTG